MSLFKLKAGFKPAGDQPKAIEKLIAGIQANQKHQTLLGVTGSGKTFTMANVIARIGRPTLVMSHNKTLAAQLYQEFKQFFPDNAVEYFVSYYDYYQPESYIPQTDTYIEKDASINDRLDRLRLSATSNLLERRDCIIVSSVSCIYNIGNPVDYEGRVVHIKKGASLDRDKMLERLVGMKYERNEIEFKRGTFRVRGDVVEIIPAYEEWAVRIEFDGDQVEALTRLDPTSGKCLKTLERVDIYPASHFVTSEEKIQRALGTIDAELKERLAEQQKNGKLLEAQRLETRTRFDMEMMDEAGYCPGVENYSRHISGRPAGARPYCLIDYFKPPFLMIIDESHATVPQVRGMYHGDRSRKKTLVEHGFRLPSALDNRPLKFDEFEGLIPQTLFVSATPSSYELEKNPNVVEQIIRPTGLVDPELEIRKTEGQIDDLIAEIRKRAQRKERVLVTTLTKRMSEELARYFEEYDLRVKYLHSEIDAIERVQILRSLRLREFDCLVGINLLREGLDLPEVSLVAILDADKEGFLRNEVSLIQTAGRAARHINGHVILYADRVTRSMRAAMKETERRRTLQLEYNKKHGITPRGIQKAVQEGLAQAEDVHELVRGVVADDPQRADFRIAESELEEDMFEASRRLEFEKAARLRDALARLRKKGKVRAVKNKTLRNR